MYIDIICIYVTCFCIEYLLICTNVHTQAHLKGKAPSTHCCVPMYIYVSIYTSIHQYICTYTYILYVYILHVFVFISFDMYKCTYTGPPERQSPIHPLLRAHIYICVCIYINISIYLYVYIYIICIYITCFCVHIFLYIQMYIHRPT